MTLWNGIELPEAYYKDDTAYFICGDSRSVLPLIPQSSIASVITSPPYYAGMDYEDKHKSPDGYKQYLELIISILSATQDILLPGGHLWVNIDDVHTSLKSVYKKNIVLPTHAHLIATLSSTFEYKEIVLWRKVRGKHASGGSHRMLGSYGRFGSPGSIPVVQEVEYVLWFKKSGNRVIPDWLRKASSLSSDQFKEWGMQIWDISAERKRNGHPAPFPISLPDRIIRLSSFVGDTVLDPFAGSGTTAIAAQQSGRKCISIELSEQYCEDAVIRYLRSLNDH